MIEFTEQEKEIEHMTKKLEAAFKRLRKEDFENWKPARVMLDWIEKDLNILPDEVLKGFEKLFTKVNELFLKKE